MKKMLLNCGHIFLTVKWGQFLLGPNKNFFMKQSQLFIAN